MIDTLSLFVYNTLMASSPLILAALGGVFTENAGIVNIGIEGMMTLGAFVGAAVGVICGSGWIGFLAAGAAGGLLALLHGFATISLRANHVISGIALNFIGPGLALFVSRILFQGATQTPSLSLDDKITKPLDGLFPANSVWDLLFSHYATVYIAVGAAVLSWFLLYRTRFGLRLRACGEHPRAAESLGIDVYRVRYAAVLISGVLAGLGGASLSVAIVSQFSPTLVSGAGFIALAAMIFGKWRPLATLRACLLFGASQALVVLLGRDDIAKVFPVPSQLVSMLPFVITLVVLVGFVGKAVAPAADGLPYERGSSQKE